MKNHNIYNMKDRMNKNLDLIIYISFYILCLIVSLIISFTALSVSFIYGYLISSFFVFICIFLNWYQNKISFEKIMKKKYLFFIPIHFSKYFCIVMNLVIIILILLFKVNSKINFYGLLFGSIMIIAINIVGFVFFKKKLDFNKENIPKK